MLAGENRDVNGTIKEQYLGEKKKQLRDGAFDFLQIENHFYFIVKKFLQYCLI